MLCYVMLINVNVKSNWQIFASIWLMIKSFKKQSDLTNN